ncbi:MAG TPA: phage holin family protein [Thermomicrobiales bacterium]|nr:phage holin family protein [Thermomicrobiales bacterium]
MNNSGRVNRAGGPPPPRDPGDVAGSDETLGTLVAGIVEDLQSIVRGEVQLAKTELKEDAGKLGRGAGMLAGGALVGLVGFIFLMLGVTYLLNKSMQMWIAAGVVGVVLLVIAAIVAMAGKNQMSAASLTPQQTIDSVKEDQQWASRQIKSVKK